MIKKGWQEANKELKDIFMEVAEEALRLYPDVEIPTEVYISNRMGGKTLGTYFRNCKFAGYGKCGERIYEFYNDSFCFSNLIYKTNKNEVYNVIVHEIAHCVANKHYHKLCKHDYEWEIVGNDIGEKFGQKVNQYVQDSDTLKLMNEKKNVKTYEVYCNHCHRVITRTRRCSIIEYPELWECGRCGYTLSKEKLF